MFFVACAIVAMLLQVYDQWSAKRVKEGKLTSSSVALVGRTSRLNLFRSSSNVGASKKDDKYDEDDLVFDVEDRWQENMIVDSTIPQDRRPSVTPSLGSLGTGTIVEDRVEIDESPLPQSHCLSSQQDQLFNDRWRATVDNAAAVSNGGLNTSSLSRQELENRLDDFVEFYTSVKRRNKLLSMKG